MRDKRRFRLILVLMAVLMPNQVSAQFRMQVRKNIPLDSIRLSDPAILADSSRKTLGWARDR